MQYSKLDLHHAPRSPVPRVAGALLLACMLAGASAAADHPVPSDSEITQVVSKLRSDPDLGADRTIRTLHFKHTSQASTAPTSIGWLVSALRWFASLSRVAFWLCVAALAALLAVVTLRALRAPRRKADALSPAALEATHVGHADIRPESLPTDIGASALILWEEQRYRAAMSLLYRGALSRLVHRHKVPIRESNTEAECIAIAGAKLSEWRSDYVSTLINCWLRAVYAERMPSAEVVRGLCLNFGPLLDELEPTPTQDDQR